MDLFHGSLQGIVVIVRAEDVEDEVLPDVLDLASGDGLVLDLEDRKT